MQSKQILDLFRDLGALLEGHFELSSGLHSSGYLQCALVLQHPAHAEMLGSALAKWSQDLTPTVVLAPALGGVRPLDLATPLGRCTEKPCATAKIQPRRPSGPRPGDLRPLAMRLESFQTL